MSDTSIQLEFRLDDSGADWRVRRMVLHEKLASLYTLDLDIALKMGEVSADTNEEELYNLLGASCCCTITRDSTERHVRGIIRRVIDRGTAGTPTYLRAHIQVVPALWALSKRVTSRLMPSGLTLPDHIATIIGEGIDPFGRKKPDLSKKTLKRLKEYPKRDYVTQYQESDLDFVMRLMQEEGISFHFEHPERKKKKEKIVFTDSNASFEEGPTIDTFSGEGNVISFCQANRIATNKVKTWDLAWKAPNNPVEEEVVGELLTDGNIELPVYEGGMITEFSEEESRKLQAQIRLEMSNAMAKQAYGKSRIIDLMPGQFSEVWTEEVESKFLITEVTAWATSTEDLGLGTYDVGGAEEYYNDFRCLDLAHEWRPPRTTPRPKIAGFQTGTVVPPDSGDEDNYTDDDGHGRVRVKLDWDPDEVSTRWIRVSQAWAGQNFGVQFLPRSGMEVALMYKDGDPDRPLVVGCLYNEINKNYFGLPDPDKTKSGIVTKSTDGEKAVDGNNILWFEDFRGKDKEPPDGQEHLYLQAQKDMNTVVKDRQTIIVGTNWANEAPDPEHLSQSTERSRTVLVGETVKEVFQDDGTTDLWADMEIDGSGAKATPKTPYEDTDSDVKVVTGNFTEEVRGNISRIVGEVQQEGRHRIETMGDYDIIVHGEDNRYLRGSQKSETEGSFWGWHGGTTVEIHLPETGPFPGVHPPVALGVFAGIKADVSVGTASLDVWAIGRFKLAAGISFEDSDGWEFKNRIGPFWKNQADNDVLIADESRAVAVQDKFAEKATKRVFYSASNKVKEVKDETTRLFSETTSKVAQDFAIMGGGVVTELSNAMGSAADVQKKALKAAKGQCCSDVDKALSDAKKKLKDAGHLSLEKKEVNLGIDKHFFNIKDKKEVVLEVDGNTFKIPKDGKVKVISKTLIKLDTKMSEGKKELKSKSLCSK